MHDRDRTVSLIKQRQPITAAQLAHLLGLREKQVRGHIDVLRAQGEPIWHDPGLGAFWWRNDVPPGRVPYHGWKRSWEGGRRKSNRRARSPVTPALEPAPSVAKATAYRQLVLARKQCRKCAGLVNPAALPNFDSDQIGPWSRWQGNLNASLLVVGQDWADVPKLAENEGRPLARYRTNQTLVDLLAAAGLSVDLPTAEDTLGVIFLTNAVLCLKLNAGAEIERNHYAHCQQFLRRTVAIVRPDIVVGMGGSAWQSVQQAFSVVPVTSLAEAVSTVTPVSLWPGGPKACGAYHCGSWGLRARPKELQLIDWRQIGRHLRRPSG